jgi:hypothetical protein
MPKSAGLAVVARGDRQCRKRFWKDWQRDLVAVGLRHRRIHDARRTFITLCRVDGAPEDVLEQITPGARGDIINVYTSLPWPTLCGAVSSLKLSRTRSAKVIQLPLAANAPAMTQAEKPGQDDEVRNAEPEGLVTALGYSRKK